MEKEKPHDDRINISIPLPKKIFKKKVIFIALGLIFLFSFYAFSVPVKEDMLRNFDFDMTVKLQAKTPIRLDDPFSFLSFIGNFESTSIILLLILFFTQLPKIKVKGKSLLMKIVEFVRHPMAGLIIYFTFGFAHVIELVGKNFLDHPGPPRFMLRSHSSDFPQFYVFTKGSYPSGHSMRMIFLLIVITFIVLNIKKIPAWAKAGTVSFLLIYSFLMLFSRVSLGEHWSTDVIAGSLLGAAFGFFSLIFL